MLTIITKIMNYKYLRNYCYYKDTVIIFQMRICHFFCTYVVLETIISLCMQIVWKRVSHITSESLERINSLCVL